MTVLIIIGSITGIYMYCCLSNPKISILFSVKIIFYMLFIILCLPFDMLAVQETLWFIYYLSLIKKITKLILFFKLKKLGEGLKIINTNVLSTNIPLPKCLIQGVVLKLFWSKSNNNCICILCFNSLQKKLSNLFHYHYLYYI